jgi:hypothetical protein
MLLISESSPFVDAWLIEGKIMYSGEDITRSLGFLEIGLSVFAVATIFYTLWILLLHRQCYMFRKEKFYYRTLFYEALKISMKFIGFGLATSLGFGLFISPFIVVGKPFVGIINEYIFGRSLVLESILLVFSFLLGFYLSGKMMYKELSDNSLLVRIRFLQKKSDDFQSEAKDF